MADKTLIYVGAEASGLYRKEAGDDRWENLTRGMAPSAQVRAIAIHPDDPTTIFAGTQRGVYRSIDRGDNWERMNMTEGRVVWSIKFHPNDSKIMFLGTEGSEVFKSEDGGEHWTYMSTISNPDSVQMAFATRILGIGIEASNPNNMYAALEVGGAAASTDGGKSWKIDDYYIGFFASVGNILDKVYKTGGFEQGRNANYRELLEDTTNPKRRFGSKYWYGRGANYFLNVYFRF